MTILNSLVYIAIIIIVIILIIVLLRFLVGVLYIAPALETQQPLPFFTSPLLLN